VKLGDIADVKQGLATGDNNAYLFQNPEARGKYRNINDYKDFILTELDLDKIRHNDKLRLKVIDKGISKDNPKSERYFGGRYIIPYDKGGESDAEGGWMPNYYVPTNYFIDWSEWAVNRMKNLTIGERDRTSDNRICSRFQSVEYSFLNFCTYSRTGIYAPTFRIGSSAAFDSKSNSIIFNNYLLGLSVSNSKVFRYLYKVFLCHTVQAESEIMLDFPFIQNEIVQNVVNITIQIVNSQKSNPRYDYASHEQIEIDKLVYEAYGLNAEDVQEVENWYARRYPKLSAAQKANLRALGKSDDYLELYGLK